MLRVVPLGGLGEIGLNAMAFCCRGEILLVDCGLMFPGPDAPGTDVVLPDFTFLRRNRDALRGVVLTHGHEDHVGALPYLLREMQVPIYGMPFTLAVARRRVEELGLEAEYREVAPREPFSVGEHFKVEPLRVTHSMPDAIGLLIDTPEGSLVHTGDFKLDPDPIDGERTDLERLGEAGDRGVLCLLSDSTNSEVEGTSGSERSVAATFERLFARAKGRVVVSLFASHLHRVQHVLDLAHRTGRRVGLVGRSILRNVEAAQGVGKLRVPPGLLASLEEIDALPPERTALIATGAQGEYRSGLANLLSPEYRGPHVAPGDLVILSSRAIPGHERTVGHLIDRLMAHGADVAYSRVEPGVHVSGHAAREEQRQMLQRVRPRHFLPIHGELKHLTRHLELARDAGVPADGLLLAQDGDVVGFESGLGGLVGREPVGRIFSDRSGDDPIPPATLVDRTRLSEAGVVAAVMVVERATGRWIAGPLLFDRGLSPDGAAFLPHAAQGARAFIDTLSPELRVDDALVRDELTQAVRRVFKARFGWRPQVVPCVVKL